MTSGWADEFERSHLTPACLRGGHETCPHGLGVGGGLNPRRLRLEFGMALCACTCHARCPLADGRRAVKPSLWREECTCPGAAAERARQAATGTDLPDFEQIMAEKRHQSELRREAGRVVRAAAAGKSRDEIRDMLIAEFRARGLDVPPEHILEANVDAIMGNYGPSVRAAGRAFAQMADGAAQIVRLFRGSGPPSDS
jgi:hypothetical protein